MKIMTLLVMVIFLTGCGKQSSVQAASAVYVQPYDIIVGVPRDASEVANVGEGTLYRHEGGEYEIWTKSFCASSRDDAIKRLTGQENLSVREMYRFGLPEYRFAWREKETMRLCRGDLVMDGENCYAVVFAVKEQFADKYDALVMEVFSTFGLFFDEGV